MLRYLLCMVRLASFWFDTAQSILVSADHALLTIQFELFVVTNSGVLDWGGGGGGGGRGAYTR